MRIQSLAASIILGYASAQTACTNDERLAISPTCAWQFACTVGVGGTATCGTETVACSSDADCANESGYCDIATGATDGVCAACTDDTVCSGAGERCPTAGGYAGKCVSGTECTVAYTQGQCADNFYCYTKTATVGASTTSCVADCTNDASCSDTGVYNADNICQTATGYSYCTASCASDDCTNTFMIPDTLCASSTTTSEDSNIETGTCYSAQCTPGDGTTCSTDPLVSTCQADSVCTQTTCTSDGQVIDNSECPTAGQFCNSGVCTVCQSASGTSTSCAATNQSCNSVTGACETLTCNTSTDPYTASTCFNSLSVCVADGAVGTAGTCQFCDTQNDIDCAAGYSCDDLNGGTSQQCLVNGCAEDSDCNDVTKYCDAAKQCTTIACTGTDSDTCSATNLCVSGECASCTTDGVAETTCPESFTCNTSGSTGNVCEFDCSTCNGFESCDSANNKCQAIACSTAGELCTAESSGDAYICITNACGECTATEGEANSCPTGYFCSTGATGQTATSGMCYAEQCNDTDKPCMENETCNSGLCETTACTGTDSDTCESTNLCVSGSCALCTTDGVAETTCPESFTCDTSGSTGNVCVFDCSTCNGYESCDPANNKCQAIACPTAGELCTADSSGDAYICITNACGECSTGVISANSCPTGYFCSTGATGQTAASGMCYAEECNDTDNLCSLNNECVNGLCQSISCTTENDSLCPSGVCDTTNELCVDCSVDATVDPNTTTCASGYWCHTTGTDTGMCYQGTCSDATVAETCQITEVCQTDLTCAQQTCAADSDCRSMLCDGTTSGSSCIACTDFDSCPGDSNYCQADGACTMAKACTAANELTECTGTLHCVIAEGQTDGICGACDATTSACQDGYTCQSDNICKLDGCTIDSDCESSAEYCNVDGQCATLNCTPTDAATTCTKTNYCTTAGICGVCDPGADSTEVCDTGATCNASGMCLTNQCTVSTQETDCTAITDYCDEYKQCSPKACNVNTECTRTEHCNQVTEVCAMCNSSTSACDQANYSCDNSQGICIEQATCSSDSDCAYNKTCDGTYCEVTDCQSDSDCRSGLCDVNNGQCLLCDDSTHMCPTGYSCQVTAGNGQCLVNECTDLTIYTECDLNDICVEGQCTLQTCTANGDSDCRSHNCSSNGTCVSCGIANVCQPVPATGDDDEIIYYCLSSGECVAAYCDPENVWAACFPNEYCNTENFQCEQQMCPNGDSDCRSGLCSNGECISCDPGAQCSDGYACQRNSTCMEITCSSDEQCADLTYACNPTYGQCEPKACAVGSDCRTNACDTTTNLCAVCTDTISCSESYYCENSTCTAFGPDCTENTQCETITDYCDTTAGSCRIQSGCTDASSCRSGVCDTTTTDCTMCTREGSDSTQGNCPDQVTGNEDESYECNETSGECEIVEDKSDDDDGLTGGAIAAIVICSILGVMGITAAIWYFMKKGSGPDSRAHDGHMSNSLINDNDNETTEGL